MCCKHTTELHEKYGNNSNLDAHDEFSRKMKTAETEERKMYSDFGVPNENLKVGLFDVLSEVKKMKVLNLKFNVSKKMMVFL